ncbi:MAG: hypothetical protein PVI26_14130 [Chitinispirillia bacterium]|jgi:hypothetical protein
MRYVVLTVTLLFFSCDELHKSFLDLLINTNSKGNEYKFIGLWVQMKFLDRKVIYEKSIEFDKNKPGIEFKSDNSLIKRQIIGWCGTPPVTYGNYTGTWKFVGTNILEVIYEYWGGQDTSEIFLDSVSNDLLILEWK